MGLSEDQLYKILELDGLIDVLSELRAVTAPSVPPRVRLRTDELLAKYPLRVRISQFLSSTAKLTLNLKIRYRDKAIFLKKESQAIELHVYPHPLRAAREDERIATILRDRSIKPRASFTAGAASCLARNARRAGAFGPARGYSCFHVREYCGRCAGGLRRPLPPRIGQPREPRAEQQPGGWLGDTDLNKLSANFAFRVYLRVNVDVEAPVFGTTQKVSEVTVVINKAIGIPRSRHIEYIMDPSRCLTTLASKTVYNWGPEVTGTTTTYAIEHDFMKKNVARKSPRWPIVNVRTIRGPGQTRPAQVRRDRPGRTVEDEGCKTRCR